jgi:hypothetical protein
MEEILFKAKRIEDDKWVYGSYVYEKGIAADTTLDGPDFYHIDVHYIHEPNTRVHEVDGNTICQYINEKDRDGEKIFKGDIVENGIKNQLLWRDTAKVVLPAIGNVIYEYGVWNLKEERKGIAVIIKKDQYISWDVGDIVEFGLDRWDGQYMGDYSDLKIIGNIYDTP